MNTFLHLKIKMTSASIWVLFACSCAIPAMGQKKNTLQLADQYYAAADYYTAANLYEQYLNAPKSQHSSNDFPLNVKRRRVATGNNNLSRADILYKQAESYRLANYWIKSAAGYKECVDKNNEHSVDALYWYAVCKRSLGEYAVAEESLNHFISSAAINNRYRADVEKELQTLQQIHRELSRPDSVLVTIQKLNIPNSNEKGAFAITQVNGNQFLISSTEADSNQVNGVNPYRSHLFYATLRNSSVEEMTRVDLPAAGIADNQGAGSISKDGNHLYFSQWKKENGRIVSSIYYSVKQDTGWSLPKILPLVNVNGYNSKQPFCSTDNNYLFFASDRPGGSGKYDIWYARIKNDGTTEMPLNAGTIINTSEDDQSPFYQTSSTTLVFSSNGRPGLGGYDLYSAKGNEVTWSLPENLGYPVNSSRDDIYFFAEEKKPILNNALVSSDRGTGCCLETYIISKAPKKKLLTGLVRDCKDHLPLINVLVVLKDASGNIKADTTDANGKYVFETIGDNYQDLMLTISGKSYKDTIFSAKIKQTDGSDLLIDNLINTDMCIEQVEKKLVIKAENVVTVYFDYDKNDLRESAVGRLDSIYNVLVEFPAATIQISGYTDGRGSELYNKKLSDKRAKACADYLMAKGIQPNRISFESFGACCPVEMELINGRDNPDGRSRNRGALINISRE